MKPCRLNGKLDSLSEKLTVSVGGDTRIDPECLTEGEWLLFKRVWKIRERYGSSLPNDVLAENTELFLKATDVIVRRTVELFLSVVPLALGGDEIEEWYFKLHFHNFLEDLKECLANVGKWSEKDREEFLSDMKRDNMINKVFRIPRGFNDCNTAKSKKKREEKHSD